MGRISTHIITKRGGGLETAGHSDKIHYVLRAHMPICTISKSFSNCSDDNINPQSHLCRMKQKDFHTSTVVAVDE